MKKVIEIKNFLTDEECDRIVATASKFDLHEATTTYPTSNYTVGLADDKFRQSKIAYIDSDVFPELTEKLLQKVNELQIFNGATYNAIYGYSFNEYTKGNFLDWHPDVAELANGATITIALELSNGFEGGVFQYKLDDKEYSFDKAKGSLFLFDSEVIHRVTEVTEGVRYSINCWPRIEIKKKARLL